MTERLSKLILLLTVAVLGLATTLTVNDFRYQQTAQSLAAAYSILTPLPPQPPMPPPPPAFFSESTPYTFLLAAGWNEVAVASTVTLADIGHCAIGWPAYEFVDEVYAPVSTLEPGHGYWVWADAPCEAELPAAN